MAMAIRAIADLHLDSGGKPMDVFGDRWEHHAERIFSQWRETVDEEDLVLVPGDISWAMTLPEARAHLDQIGALPGKKLLLRGNHDYWWASIARVRDALPNGMWALQNDAFEFGAFVVAGSRGWTLPGEGGSAEDQKIYERELIRLEMSLKDARRRGQDKRLVAMMHFPPLTGGGADTGFSRLLQAYGAEVCVYGHLHGAALMGAVRGEVGGVRYVQASSDGVGFRPVEVVDDSHSKLTINN